MTENEAIEILREKYMDIEYYFAEHDCYREEYDAEFQEAMATAMKSLQEIQKYRAIETGLRERYHANVGIKTLMQHFIEAIFKGEKHEGFCVLTNEDAKMWKEYCSIGTVEEFREAREMQMGKKPMLYGDFEDGKLLCPNCEEDLMDLAECGFECCPYCGQKLDWSE